MVINSAMTISLNGLLIIMKNRSKINMTMHFNLIWYMSQLESAFVFFINREKTSLDVIDPLNVRKHFNYNRFNSLIDILNTYYKLYQRLRPNHHPDKGGDPIIFNRITSAMGAHKVLLDILMGDRNHSDLKAEYQQAKQSGGKAPLTKEEFDAQWASTDAHVFDADYHRGYDITPSDIQSVNGIPQRRNIDIERMSEATPRRFQEAFRQQKLAHTSGEVIPYTPPMASNDNVAGSTTTFLELGRTVENFTVPINTNSINYTDYRDAYENPFLIDESQITQPTARNVEEMIRMRKEPNNMSRDQQQAVEQHNIKMEIEEARRQERFRQQQLRYLK